MFRNPKLPHIAGPRRGCKSKRNGGNSSDALERRNDGEEARTVLAPSNCPIHHNGVAGFLPVADRDVIPPREPLNGPALELLLCCP